MDGGEKMLIRIRGVRGSYPVSGQRTIGFGGNTTCHEVRAGGRLFIFDAGTGIISLGDEIIQEKRGSAQAEINLFFTHVHHDHTLGLLFFKPAYQRNTVMEIFGPRTFAGSVQQSLREISLAPFHPVGLDEMGAEMRFTSLIGGEIIRFRADGSPPEIVRLRETFVMSRGDVVVRVAANPNHTKIGVLHYRLDYAGKAYVFATDVEGTEDGDPTLSTFAAGADVLAHDAQYTDFDYYHDTPPKRGWGHSTYKMACATARRAGVRKLLLIHHDPDRDDAALEALEAEARAIFPGAVAAREGMTIEL